MRPTARLALVSQASLLHSSGLADAPAHLAFHPAHFTNESTHLAFHSAHFTNEPALLAFHSAHFTNEPALLAFHSAHFTNESTHLAFHSAHFTNEPAHLAFHSAHFTNEPAHLAFHSAHFTNEPAHLAFHSAHFTNEPALLAFHSAHFTNEPTLLAFHSAHFAKAPTLLAFSSTHFPNAPTLFAFPSAHLAFPPGKKPNPACFSGSPVYPPKKVAIISLGDRYIKYEGDDMTAFQQELDALFEENRPLVYRTAYNITGSTSDADDVLQNVFVKLLKGQPSSDLPKNPKGYFYRAATNEALEILRSRECRKRLEEDLRSMPAPAPVSESDRDEQIAQLRAATAKMKPGHVETLTLHYSEGLRCADIAKIRGKPLGTVLADLYRGRAEMKRLVPKEVKHGETQKGKHERDRSQVLAGAPGSGNGRGVGPGPAAAPERA